MPPYRTLRYLIKSMDYVTLACQFRSGVLVCMYDRDIHITTLLLAYFKFILIKLFRQKQYEHIF